METVDNSPSCWSDVLETLKSRLGSEVVSRWFEPLKITSFTDDEMIIEAPNHFFRDWVSAHYTELLKQIVGNRNIQIITTPAIALTDVLPQTTKSLQPGASESSQKNIDSPATTTTLSRSATTPSAANLKLTFDRFVVGAGNRFAHAASIAVAESPAKAYNPLFIYGGVGLGKTHLMQAIGEAILQRRSNQRVVYISSEKFTNELIMALQTKTTARFRDRYRTVDVLLVDDIHFIAGKEATQEEFFHTFNSLYDAHKQIVMSSDRSPKEITGLEERLVSRFEWGLVTDIQPPDLETRIAILLKKAEEAEVSVPNPVIQFIASQIKSNIRELEGALVRVLAYCNFFNKPATAEVAQEILKDMLKEVSSRVTIHAIQQCITDYFHIELTELKSAKRHRSVLYPRQVAMFLCRKLTESSLPEIGRAFGGRDHTTVMHAISKVEKEIEQDINKKRLVEHLNRLVVAAP